MLVSDSQFPFGYLLNFYARDSSVSVVGKELLHSSISSSCLINRKLSNSFVLFKALISWYAMGTCCLKAFSTLSIWERCFHPYKSELVDWGTLLLTRCLPFSRTDATRWTARAASSRAASRCWRWSVSWTWRSLRPKTPPPWWTSYSTCATGS